jgi:hypothetical protein
MWNKAWNDLVFFPNNWIYDTTNGCWWQSEDTNVVNFGQYANQRYGARYLYAMQGGMGSSLQVYAFDGTTRATSWAWTSNPIPVTQDNLVSLRRIVLVVSNPTSSPAQFTVIPTSPGSTIPIAAGNNPQSIVFTIPPHSEAHRVGANCGYTDYNIQLVVIAGNLGNMMGPILHSITVQYQEANEVSLV